MSMRGEGLDSDVEKGKLIKSSDLTRIKFDLSVRGCHLKEKLVPKASAVQQQQQQQLRHTEGN